MEMWSESSTSSKRPDSTGSPSKSSASDAKIPALAISAGAHVAVVSLLAFMIALGRGAPEKIEIDVIEKPVAAPVGAQLDLAKPPPKPPPKPAQAPRKVFGVSRKAITADSAEPGGVQVKEGNTVATAPDKEKLKAEDARSLPIPTDEYLVTKMPSVAADVRIPYPPEAKQKKIEGKVVLELLIDANGVVRDVRLLSGPVSGLNEAAIEAIKRFKFKPAEVEGKPVAVKIPFTYNFVLQSE